MERLLSNQLVPGSDAQSLMAILISSDLRALSLSEKLRYAFSQAIRLPRFTFPDNHHAPAIAS